MAAAHEPPNEPDDGVEGMLQMSSKFMDEAANAPAPSRPVRRILSVMLAVVGALVLLGWMVLLFGD